MITARMEKNIFRALARQLSPRARAIEADTRRDIVAIARQLVPVDTGELRDSIHETFLGVAADADHAAPVEYGVPGRTPARPFLTPAAERCRPVMIARLRAADDLFREEGL